MTRIHRQDVLRHLRIHPTLMRAWERKGLIPHSDTYSLEEYGRLRTLRELSVTFSSSAICASVGAMKSVAGMENPLLEARAVGGGPRVHFWHRGVMTEPIARQFVFNFDAGGVAETQTDGADLIPMTRMMGGNRAPDLFLEAIRCEDSARIDEAAEIYERILYIDPQHAASCINLGTICYNRRQFCRAEQLYRRATEADSEYALAFFDLGNALDELKRLPEAICSYRSAVRLIPTYADAHYNLALAYERAGERRMALRHWTAYLKLDGSSRWASHARKQVRRILDRETLAIVHRSPRAIAPRASKRKSFADTVPTAG